MPVGDYVYETTFTLTGDDLSGFTLDGQWATDNGGVDIKVNGVSAGLTTPAEDFHLRDFTLSSGFVIGVNTVQFVVHNDTLTAPGQNPTALRVEWDQAEHVTPAAPLTAVAGLYNTGVGDDGQALAGGVADTHWQLIASPDPSFQGPQAAALNDGWPVAPYGPWVGNAADVRWVSPRADAGGTVLPGDYVYQTTFDLTGYDPSQVTIAGTWATDNDGVDILVNGQGTGHATPFADFQPHAFSISGGFVAGLNTLSFIVHNGGDTPNPTGLRVRFDNAPVLATADSYDVQHGTMLQLDAGGGVLANDQAAAGRTLAAVQDTAPQHGDLVLNGDGSFTYTPNAGYVGADSFSYHATSGGLSTPTVTVSLNVTDEAPLADDVTYTVEGGGVDRKVAGDLTQLGNDPDFQDTPSFAVFSGPQHGTLSFNADGTFVYRPDAHFVGDDSFTYTVGDGAMTSEAGTVTILVEDEAPVAVDIAYDVAAGGTLDASDDRKLVEGAAYDMDADDLTLTLVTGPQHAEAFELYPDGTFLYVPEADFIGEDHFTFEVSDGVLSSEEGTVTLNVTDTPVAHDDVYMVPESGPLVVDADHGLLANDFLLGGGSYTSTGTTAGAQSLAGAATSITLIDAPAGLTVNNDGSLSFATVQRIVDNARLQYQVIQTVNGVVVSNLMAFVTFIRNGVSAEVATERWSNGAFAITPDKGGAPYGTTWVGPALKKIAPDTTLSMKTPADGRLPMAVVARKTVDVVVTFKVIGLFAVDPKALHVFPGMAMIPPFHLGAMPQVTTFDAEKGILSVTMKGLRVEDLPGVYDGMSSQWDILPGWGRPGPQQVPVTGGGKYRVYVLNETPASAVLRNTAVRVGTVAAGKAAEALVTTLEQAAKTKGLEDDNVAPWIEGQIAARNGQRGFRDSVADYVMKEFETKRIEQVDDKTGVARVLTYYGSWAASDRGTTSFSQTTQSLLRKGDGDCVAWGDFFSDVLKAQGNKGTKEFAVEAADKSGGTYALYVKNWAATGAGPLVNTFRGLKARNVKGKAYVWGPNPKVEKQVGIGGQGNDDPPAGFANHVLVEIKYSDRVVVFDPSYALTYGKGAAKTNNRKDLFPAIATSSVSFYGRINVLRGIVQFFPVTTSEIALRERK